MKTLVLLAVTVMLGTALVGCKAEGKVSDAASNISVPR
jgi:hypothetical protein